METEEKPDLGSYTKQLWKEYTFNNGHKFAFRIPNQMREEEAKEFIKQHGLQSVREFEQWTDKYGRQATPSVIENLKVRNAV